MAKKLTDDYLAGVGTADILDLLERIVTINSRNFDSYSAPIRDNYTASLTLLPITYGGLINNDLTPGMLVDGTTMVPLRNIGEFFQFDVQWSAEDQKITTTKDDVVLILQIGNLEVTNNGTSETLSVAPMIINEKPMFLLDISPKL